MFHTPLNAMSKSITHNRALAWEKNRPNFDKVKVGDYYQNAIGTYLKIIHADKQTVTISFENYVFEVPDSATVFPCFSF
jgi:hypothetical protein